jgi:YD repeat-containing protein
MNTTRLLIGFTGLLLVGALLSCEDHRSQVVTPGANRLRVKRIEQGSQPGAARFVFTVTDFAYDAQNRLSSTTTYRPDSVAFPFERTLYQYDTQNRLTRVEHSEIRGGSRTETYFLTYNPAGQLAQVANLPSGISVAFQYNAANQLTGYTKALNVPGFRSTGGAGTLTFTGSNLTTELADFSVFREGESPSAPPVYSWGGKMTYTYDVNGINPFYGVFVIPEPGQFFSPPGTSNFGPVGTLYGGIDNLFNVSPRNVATAFVSTGFGPPYREIYYNHTYNAVGLPTHRGIATFPFKIAQFVDYEYESY